MQMNRKGFVLPSVIFAISIMSIIAVAVINTVADERRASRATRESTLAMYAAEAGLRATFGNWPVAAVGALQPGDSLDLGWQNMPNKAAYRSVIHRVDGGGLQEYSLVVQGRRTDPTAGIVTIVAGAGGVPIFGNAVRTEGNLLLDNGGLFDAFDSDVASYSAATADTIANLRAGADININRTTVKGSGTATGAIVFGTMGVITGAHTSGAAPATVSDILSCPAGGFTPSAKVPAGPGVSYNSVTGVLTVSGGATLTLTDSTYFFRSVVLTGNAKLAFPAGAAHVNVKIADSLNAAAGTIMNLAGKSTALSFESCGTSATPAYWALSSGGTASFYSVYAPNHVVYETGAGDFYGAVVASIYYATGGGRFHYDAALARQPSRKISIQKGTWAQLPGA
jgi:type II secretory pathway pseudopilin PulG